MERKCQDYFCWYGKGFITSYLCDASCSDHGLFVKTGESIGHSPKSAHSRSVPAGRFGHLDAGQRGLDQGRSASWPVAARSRKVGDKRVDAPKQAKWSKRAGQRIAIGPFASHGDVASRFPYSTSSICTVIRSLNSHERRNLYVSFMSQIWVGSWAGLAKSGWNGHQ